MHRSLCALPWIHLATHPHGGVTLCCQSEMKNGLSTSRNHGKPALSLNETSVKDILNSDVFKEVRLAMLRGERPAECAPCWDREDKGIESKRLFDAKRYPFTLEEARLRTAADGSIEPAIEFAELRLGNICNIKCITCNPNSSSKHIPDYEKMIASGISFLNDYSWVKAGLYSWVEDSRFWDDLADYSSELKEIYINGGEPMLINKHFDYLEKLVSSGRSKEITIVYSLNLTQLPVRAKELWSQFKKVRLECSIDDWDQRNFYIRFPTPWEKVMQNLFTVQDWGVELQILQTVSALNFYYLGDFYQKMRRKFPAIHIGHNYVMDPPWFSPRALSVTARKKILSRLKGELPGYLYDQLDRMFGAQVPSNGEREHLLKILKSFDEIRDLEVTEYFPELESLLAESGEGFKANS